MEESPGQDAQPVDWRVARNLTGGDVELLQELVDLFPGECAKHLIAIHEAIDRADAVPLTRAAHTLKSSARLFGAGALAACALRIETLAASADLDEAARHVAELEAEVRRVSAALAGGPGSPSD